ncbi:hypothetical protein, conserved in T. vivax [Trypanosoma vivax Y486]|uniref:Trypanosome variant surface glycoprotein A-type N-terminal domain-containing protein n=1 Tax=Trypanosoma vivax (strain Y486) TaxID=1055687 RepID=F9WPN5_TRYVY|nr:hypothetical protein, conserved in T. vivax [Trypanosoma vivax Y486]|eukprot:CCD19512.1 hypothetical protein, conserved in T. vivax [Trypanosoma vivax Y486]
MSSKLFAPCRLALFALALVAVFRACDATDSSVKTAKVTEACGLSGALKKAANAAMLDTQDITERLGAMKAAVAYAKLWAAAWQQCRQGEDAQAHERKVSSFVERLDEAFTQAERKAQEAQEQAKNIVTQAANIAGKIDGFMQTLSTYTPGTTKTNRACVTDDGNQGTLGSGSAKRWEYTAFNECRSPPSTADYAALVDKATTTSTQIHKAAANKAIGSTCSIFSTNSNNGDASTNMYATQGTAGVWGGLWHVVPKTGSGIEINAKVKGSGGGQEQDGGDNGKMKDNTQINAVMTAIDQLKATLNGTDTRTKSFAQLEKALQNTLEEWPGKEAPGSTVIVTGLLGKVSCPPPKDQKNSTARSPATKADGSETTPRGANKAKSDTDQEGDSTAQVERTQRTKTEHSHSQRTAAACAVLVHSLAAAH